MYSQWLFLFLSTAFLTGCYLEGGSCTGSVCLSVATEIDGDNCDFGCDQQYQCPDADSVRVNSQAALNFARQSLQSASRTSCSLSSGQNSGPRADPITPSVIWNETLFAAADRHARDMAANNFVALLGSDGVSVDSRVAGLDSSVNQVSLLAAGGFANAQALINEWLRQPGDCASLLDSTVTQFAMACRFDRNTDFGTYWSLVLATDETLVEAN